MYVKALSIVLKSMLVVNLGEMPHLLCKVAILAQRMRRRAWCDAVECGFKVPHLHSFCKDRLAQRLECTFTADVLYSNTASMSVRNS